MNSTQSVRRRQLLEHYEAAAAVAAGKLPLDLVVARWSGYKQLDQGKTGQLTAACWAYLVASVFRCKFDNWFVFVALLRSSTATAVAIVCFRRSRKTADSSSLVSAAIS